MRGADAGGFGEREPVLKERPAEGTGGESFQPTNHSKLTDSNNCVFFFLLTNNYSCFSLDSPPPCALCRSLFIAVLSANADMLNTSHFIAQVH